VSKIVALNNEIMLRLGTPEGNCAPDQLSGMERDNGSLPEDDSVHRQSSSHSEDARTAAPEVHRAPEHPPALRIRAKLNLLDLFEDSRAVQLSVQVIASLKY